MELTERKPRYRAYLLRCWEAQNACLVIGVEWRFSLEDPHSGQRRNFAGLDLLIAALQADLMADGDAEEPDPGASGERD